MKNALYLRGKKHLNLKFIPLNYFHFYDSTRHNGKGHTPTGKHWHNLIPNTCFHISYMVYVLWYIV